MTFHRNVQHFLTVDLLKRVTQINVLFFSRSSKTNFPTSLFFLHRAKVHVKSEWREHLTLVTSVLCHPIAWLPSGGAEQGHILVITFFSVICKRG